MPFPHYPKSREIYSHTGLRGIAAVSVFLAHMYDTQKSGIFEFIKWHNHAVDLFFILSGFILFWVYFREETPINWAAYLRARIGRILPLYYLTTLIYLPVPFYSLLKHGLKYVGRDYPFTILSNLFMFSGIIDGWHHTINGPAWSIGVEFFCYLFIFPLLIIAWGKSFNVKNTIIILAFISLALTILLPLCYKIHHIQIFHLNWDASWLARGICGFTLGFFLCALFRISAVSSWRPNKLLINLILLISVVIFLLARTGCITADYLLYIFPILVYITAFDQGVFSFVMKLTPLQWLGERSYSLYLWHMPVLCMIGSFYKPAFERLKTNPPYGITYLIFAVSFVLMISELSYRYFEVPCRDYIRSLGKKSFTVDRKKNAVPIS
jgi:peptidoglycan/LPS O-acetylase OafA/YrhL